MKLLKKIAVISGSVLGLLILVLAIHIYIVTRPQPPDPGSRMMVRIDIKQPITAGEATSMNCWLYQQKGVDHSVCNPDTKTVIFTFSPLQNNADDIVKNFKSNFKLAADRYVPSADEMKMGCPMASASFTNEVYNFFHQL